MNFNLKKFFKDQIIIESKYLFLNKKKLFLIFKTKLFLLYC